MKKIFYSVGILASLFASVFSEPFGPEGDYSIINEDVFGNEVKCLVCKASIKELDDKLKSIDPSKTEDVGGYKFDSDGNLKKKSLPQVQSEIFISSLIDEICSAMENYVRARWKSTGDLTLLRMVDSNGKMNTEIMNVDLIQDDDLNKSLEFYCKSVFEEYEENIIDHYKKGSENVPEKVCVIESRLCPMKKDQNHEFNKEEL